MIFVSIWLTSLSLITGSIHVAANGIISFFLWLTSIPYTYHIFDHSSVNGHLGCFLVLAIVNSAAMNTIVHLSFQIRVFSRYILLVVGLQVQAPMLAIFLKGTSIMFFIVKVKVTQLCPTLCDPMDYTVLGILQASILEWVAFPFSRGSPQPRNQTRGLLQCRRILYQLSHQGSPVLQ